MNTALLNAAARIFFILAFFGVLPDNMKHQTFEIIHLSVNTGKLENPVQIAVLSDLHMHEYGPDNADLVNAVRGEQPDIITIIGDMVNKKEDEYSLVLTLCRQLTEIAPVYYV